MILAYNLSVVLQPSRIAVGQTQEVICSISVPPDVDPDTIELGWLNEEDIVTNDSRVTIYTSSNYLNGTTLSTIIHFNLLTEEDANEFTCYASVNGSFIFESISLQNIASTLVVFKHLHAHMYVRIHIRTYRLANYIRIIL